MDRLDCINSLVAAGMTWSEATYLFHNSLARYSMSDRWYWLNRYVALTREERSVAE